MLIFVGLSWAQAASASGASSRKVLEDRATALDEQVEVGFTIDPAIRPLRYARPEISRARSERCAASAIRIACTGSTDPQRR